MKTYLPGRARGGDKSGANRRVYKTRRKAYGTISAKQLRIPRAIAEKIPFVAGVPYGVESIEYDAEDAARSGVILFTIVANPTDDALKVQIINGAFWIYVGGFLTYSGIDDAVNIPIAVMPPFISAAGFKITCLVPPKYLWGDASAVNWALAAVELSKSLSGGV